MGSPTYESVGSVLYDNKYAGAVSANTTRGWTTFKIRASGKVGAHVISYEGSSHTVPYLNMEQSPVPWTGAHQLKFTVTKDAGAPKPSLEWPADGAADDERADDRPLRRASGIGDGPARHRPPARSSPR